MEEIGMVHVRTVDCMYCRADVHFIVFYILALRDAFSKVQYSISRVFFSCCNSHATNDSPHWYRLPIIHSVLFQNSAQPRLQLSKISYIPLMFCNVPIPITAAFIHLALAAGFASFIPFLKYQWQGLRPRF